MIWQLLNAQQALVSKVRHGIFGMLLAIALVAPSSVAWAASSETVYVSTSGNDATGLGTAAKPFATVAHALDVATNGSTIILEPGTYHTKISVKQKAITLESDPKQANAVVRTIIDATGQSEGVLVSGAAAAGTVVRALTIEHANGQGVLIDSTARVTIENNVVVDNALSPGQGPSDYKIMPEYKAIQLVGSPNSTIRNNTVKGNGHGGIAVLDSQASAATGDVISGNQVIDNRGDCGIVVASYLPGRGVDHNTIEGNTVSGNVAGIIVAADPPGTSATDNTVRGNTIVGNHLPGIILHSNAPNQVVSGNAVIGNTIRGNGSDPDVQLNQAAGIAILGANVPVTNTTLRGNQISDESVPVWQFDPAAKPLVDPHTLILGSGIAVIVLGGLGYWFSISRKVPEPTAPESNPLREDS